VARRCSNACATASGHVELHRALAVAGQGRCRISLEQALTNAEQWLADANGGTFAR
jgi:hypothetical protein